MARWPTLTHLAGVPRVIGCNCSAEAVPQSVSHFRLQKRPTGWSWTGPSRCVTRRSTRPCFALRYCEPIASPTWRDTRVTFYLGNSSFTAYGIPTPVVCGCRYRRGRRKPKFGSLKGDDHAGYLHALIPYRRQRQRRHGQARGIGHANRPERAANAPPRLGARSSKILLQYSSVDEFIRNRFHDRQHLGLQIMPFGSLYVVVLPVGDSISIVH